MNPPPNREVALFSAALELPASQRGAYLAEACADDPALCLRLEALLRVHEEAIPFQERDGFFMNPEQGLEAQAQGGIIGASLSQIGTTLAGGQLQGRAKEGHFTIGRGVHGLLNAIGNLKSQAPFEAPNSKHEAPEKPQIPSSKNYSAGVGLWLELDGWCLSGSWCLMLGAYSRAPSHPVKPRPGSGGVGV